jgi:transmembrane sensor
MSEKSSRSAESYSRSERAAEWAVRLMERMQPTGQQELTAWLAADPLNGQALEEVVAAWHAVDQYAGSAEIMAMRESALAEGRRASSRRHGWPIRRRGWLVAAALLFAIGSGGIWRWLTPQAFATGLGERRIVALSDGSKISLDASTIVQIAYSHDKRQLWLKQGRAKFDVAKDPLRPFSVSAANKMVVATGTSFSVECIENQVRIVLYDGHVAVLESSGRNEPHPIDVGPKQVPVDRLLSIGNELILPAAKAFGLRFEPVSIQPIDAERSLSWESGLLIFEDEPLELAIDRMNRYAKRPLVIADPDVARLRISGVFHAGDTDALLEGLAAAFAVEARQGTDAISLFNARHSKRASSPAF